jgi:hypothetical protein
VSKDQEKLILTQEDLSSLQERIKGSNLATDDVVSILSMLQLIVSMKQLLTKRKLGLLLWLRRIFGVKTEKLPVKSGVKKQSHGTGNGRRGRNGRDDYPGADKTAVAHPTLSAGDDCPECHEGKLREDKPAVDYDWQGSAPIHLHIYLLQRLICHICKTAFTAPSPVAETAKTVDDSEDKEKVTRSNRNAFANAVVACLRYMFGIPHYRLAKIQGRLGIGLPEATQYLMVKQVYDAGVAIYGQLIQEAAQGCLFLADDTAIKILDWLGGKGPPTKTTKEPRKTAQTSAIISKSADGRAITLFLTGENQAGHNMSALLDLRTSSSGVPIYMCDGLSANKVNLDHTVIQVHCLDHARRKFFELNSSFPKQCQHVLDQLSLIYKADKEARQQNLSPDQRLKYHREHSKKIMDSLGHWMQHQLKTEAVEENGPLGGAMNYSLKRWTELTEFLHTPGVPLSNTECERAIKTIITHRKNSLFYKTAKGAHVGDVVQSLVATCQASQVNCFKYLAWLQENKSQVKAHPENFLPWHFQA